MNHYNKNRISNESCSMHQPVDTVDMLEELILKEFGSSFNKLPDKEFAVKACIGFLRLRYEYQDQSSLIEDEIFDDTNWFPYYDFLESLEENKRENG